jgi:hypothetical protein
MLMAGAGSTGWRIAAIIAAGVSLASCAAGETGMERAVLFSAVEGRVIRGGRPVAGATLLRQWEFAQDKVRGQDQATTDANGRFRLPAVLHDYRKPRFFAQQFVVSQMIRVRADGRDWEAWVASKHDRDAGTERAMGPVAATDSAQPLQVVIDLDAPMALRGGVAGHTIFGDQP